MSEVVNFIRIFMLSFLLFGCSYPVIDKYYYGEFDSGKIKLFLYESAVSGESDYIEIEFFMDKEVLPQFNDLQFSLENKCCVIQRDTSTSDRYYEFLVDDVNLLYDNNERIILELKNGNKLVKRIILMRRQKKRMKAFSGH